MIPYLIDLIYAGYDHRLSAYMLRLCLAEGENPFRFHVIDLYLLEIGRN